MGLFYRGQSAETGSGCGRGRRLYGRGGPENGERRSATAPRGYSCARRCCRSCRLLLLTSKLLQVFRAFLQNDGLFPLDQFPDLILTANGGMKQQTSYSAWGMRGIGGGMGGISPEQNVEAT